MNWTVPLLLLVSIIIIFASLVLHELGHLVCGLLTGYKFKDFKTLWFRWYKEEKSIKFQITKAISMDGFAAGHCRMIPTQNYKDFKFFWYLFGGVFVNLLTVLISLSLFFVLEPTGLGEPILIITIISNLMFVIINLIPRDDHKGDGSMLLLGLRSDDDRRSLHVMFFMIFLNENLAKGVRLRDLPPEMFKIADEKAIENEYIASTVLLDAARLEDMGKYSLALKQLERIRLADLPLSCKKIKTAADVAAMYLYSTFTQCFQQAKAIYSDQNVQEFLAQDLPSNWQILSAYNFFVLGDQIKGWELFEKAKAAAINETNVGIRDTQIDGLEILEGLMQAHLISEESVV